MFDFLKRPYPFSYQPSRRIKQLIPIGLVVFSFLILFKPFGLSDDSHYVLTSAYMSFCGTFTGLLTTVIIPFYFPRYFNESKWTLKRNLIWNTIVFFIFTTMMFFAFNLYGIYRFDNRNAFTLDNYFWWVYISLIFALPLSIIINLVNQYFLLKKHVKVAYVINNSYQTILANKESTKSIKNNNFFTEQKVSNELDEQKEFINSIEFDLGQFKKVLIEIKDILYIEALGNYVTVFYESNAVKKITVREVISNIEDKLHTSGIIFRPHRSYLVNLQKIEKIIGDSQGLKLHLKLTDKIIPVSRNKIKEFRRRITPDL